MTSTCSTTLAHPGLVAMCGLYMYIPRHVLPVTLAGYASEGRSGVHYGLVLHVSTIGGGGLNQPLQNNDLARYLKTIWLFPPSPSGGQPY